MSEVAHVGYDRGPRYEAPTAYPDMSEVTVEGRRGRSRGRARSEAVPEASDAWFDRTAMELSKAVE